MTTLTAQTITAETAARAYRAANDAGNGYAPYAADTVEAAVDAAMDDGYEVVLRCGDGLVVVADADGRMICIGDVHGAWACDIGGAS